MLLDESYPDEQVIEQLASKLDRAIKLASERRPDVWAATLKSEGDQ